MGGDRSRGIYRKSRGISPGARGGTNPEASKTLKGKPCIKLTDYGMCTMKENSAGEATSTFCGPPNYIVPKIDRAEDYVVSVDWRVLRVLMYEMWAVRSTSWGPQTGCLDTVMLVYLFYTL